MSQREREVELVREEWLKTGERTFHFADQTVYGVERLIPLWLTYLTWGAIIPFFVLLIWTRYQGFVSTVREMPAGGTKTFFVILMAAVAVYFLAILLYWMWRLAKFVTGYSQWALRYRDGRLWGTLLYFGFQLFFLFVFLDPLNRVQRAILDFKKFTGFRTAWGQVIYFPYTFEVVWYGLWLIFWLVVASAFWPAIRATYRGIIHALRLMQENGVSILTSMLTTLDIALFQPPATYRHPSQPVPVPRQSRGMLRLDLGKLGQLEAPAEALKAAAAACPDGLIRVEEEGGRPVRVLYDVSRCYFCGLCVEADRHGVLEFVPRRRLLTRGREELVVDLLELARAEQGEAASGEVGEA